VSSADAGRTGPPRPLNHCLLQVRCTLRTEGYVRGLALDPDGKFVAAANADGTLLLWGLNEGAAGASASSHSYSQELKKKWAPKVGHVPACVRACGMPAVVGESHRARVWLGSLFCGDHSHTCLCM
jgi:WD40 repeat protein